MLRLMFLFAAFHYRWDVTADTSSFIMVEAHLDNSKLPNEKLEKNNHGIRVLFPNSNKIPVIAVMT